jgi:Tol biopolymer transport system component
VWDFDLYAQAVGQGSAVRLTSDPLTSDLSPVWSPDGRRLAFLRRRSGETEQLMVMPALGGTQRRIASLQTGITLLGDGLLSWTPDGTRVVVGAAVEGTRGIWLFGADGDGDGRTLLVRTPGNARDRSPVVSADGRHLAFIRQSTSYGGNLCVLPLGPRHEAAGPVATVVAPAPLQVVGVAWAPTDDALVYAVGGHHAPTRLYRAVLADDRLSLAGEPVVMQVGDMALGVDIAPSGHMAYAAMQRDTRFWRFDLAEPTDGVRDAQLLESTLDEATPSYSPDGRRIAFASTRSGTQEIWVGNADGTGPRQMTQMGGAQCMDPRWSPDGRRILFSSDRTGSSDVYELDDAGATSRRLTSTAAAETAARWSRDGHSIYYASDVTGRLEIWKMPAAGGAAGQVTTSGGLVAEESHDGRQLLVLRGGPRGPALWRMPVTGGEQTLLAEGLVTTFFAVGRDAVYYLAGASHGRRAPAERARATTSTTDDVAVMKVDLTTGRKQRLASYETGFWYGLALSPDERTLLGVMTSGGTDVMFVEPARQ